MIDSHAHLTSDELFPNIDLLTERANQSGIKQIINICTDISTLKRGIAAAKQHPCLFNTASTTPHDVDQEGDSFFPIVKKAAEDKQLVAIGETGLDYFHTHSSVENQKLFFIRYLHLALETDLPVIIHCREAFADFFEIIDQEYPSHRGVLHCFTGTLEEAKKVLDRGWMLSLSGIVTFKKSHALKEVAKIVPLDRLFIETDAPYLAPQSRRGKINEPAFLPEIAEVIADIKNVSVAKITETTAANAAKFFNLP